MDIDIQSALHILKSTQPMIFAHKRGESSPEQYHFHINSYVELYTFVSGSADYVLDDRICALSAGDTVIIPPHTVHMPILREPCIYERFYLLVPTDLFSAFCHDPLKTCLESPNRSPFIHSDSEHSELLPLLFQISGLLEQGADPETQFTCACLAMEYIGRLMQTASDSTDSAADNGNISVPVHIREIMTYVHAHFSEKLSVSGIAEQFHLSVPYVSASFRQWAGVPLSSYIRSLRITLAKRMLEEGGSCTEVCYACGFDDLSYFIKAFRSCMGITPHQYQKRVGNVR